MLRVEGSTAPLFLHAREQTVGFLLTVDASHDLDIKPKKYANVSIHIEKLSSEMEKKLKNDEEYVVKITILSQLLLEQKENLYKNDLYKILAEIVRQGQKEGSVAKGDAVYLADLYWGTVYMYALKKLFVPDCKMVTKDTLSHLLVK